MPMDAGTGAKPPAPSGVGVAGRGRCGQASKGAWGMSGRQEAQGRGRRRNARGSCQPSFDPGVPESTRGTETSQYPEEKKETSTPSVAASERGPAQTTGTRPGGVVGPAVRLRVGQRNRLEGGPQRVTAPYAKAERS